MLQPRLTLAHLAPLCLAACILPNPDRATSPLRPPRPGDRFDLPAPAAEPRGESQVGIAEASSDLTPFGVEAPIPAGPPALRLEFESDLAGTVGTPLPFALLVTNDGPGAAAEVIVLAALPPELAGPDDRAVLELLRPALAPGESAALRAPLTAHRAGIFTVDALASSLNGPIVGPIRAEVVIREFVAPSAERDEIARIEALEAILDSVPRPAAVLVSAAEAPAAESPTPAARVAGESLAEEPARERAAASRDTIRLEVTGADGEVFVGDRTDYRVRVTNLGESPRQDLTLHTSLDEGLDILSGSGATDVAFEGGRMRAAPLAHLAPGETAEWRLVARSYRPGDGQLRFSITCAGGDVSEKVVTTSFEEWGR